MIQKLVGSDSDSIVNPRSISCINLTTAVSCVSARPGLSGEEGKTPDFRACFFILKTFADGSMGDFRGPCASYVLPIHLRGELTFNVEPDGHTSDEVPGFTSWRFRCWVTLNLFPSLFRLIFPNATL